jgi:DNA-binding NarL/FixJ family response regulator
MKILIIDDDKDLLDNIGIILDLAGYEVVRANNGLAGVQLANETHPDLIISDVMMPEMTGYEVLEELQSNSATFAIPLIFLTSQSELEDIRRGMLAGADDYLTKPFTEEGLLAAVQKRLEKRQRLELEQRLQFSQELLQRQESDLASISQELELGLRQKLINLKFWADSQSKYPNTTREMLLEAVQNSLDMVLTEVNRISYKIYPAMLPQLGLILSLQWYFNTRLEVYKTHVHFETFAMDSRLHPNIELCFYRIVQRIFEHLGNYSEEIHVVLWRDEEIVHLSLSQLPSLNQQKDSNFFHLLEEYANTIEANLLIRHDETQTAFYLTLSNAVFQTPGAQKRWQTVLDYEPIVLAVSSDKALLDYLEADLELKITQHDFTDLDRLFHQINLNQPQITILDIQFSSEILKLLSQKTAVIMLSSNLDENFARQALQAGLMAIVPKMKVSRELFSAIQTVLHGESYISASFMLSGKPKEKKATLNLDLLLTIREREILDLILLDLTHADIAARLVISPRTVEKHRANIMQKLGLNTHTELILFALRHGLITEQ